MKFDKNFWIGKGTLCMAPIYTSQLKKLGSKLAKVFKFKAFNIQIYYAIGQHATFTSRIQNLNVIINF
jgi:hypothetical protein